MSCPTCNNGGGPVVIGGLSQILASINSPCTNTLCPSPQDSQCTFYTAANLPCSGINTQDSLQTALQKIDTLLCASSANYSAYNTYCLAPISTQQQFVETISNYVCNTNTALTVFTGQTFPAYQTTITSSLLALQVPGTTSTCSNLVIPGNSTLQTILQKLSNGVCDIYTTQLASNISAANWNSCNTVSPTPSTLTSAFNVVISQICTLQNNQSGPLPLFNNTGTCLPSSGTNDSLVSTVGKITTLLCQTPVLNINTLGWNCVTKPSSNATDLQGALTNILAKLDSLSRGFPSFSGDFSLSQTNPSNTCGGITVGLSTNIADRFVAATASDNTPGTLQAKLVSGTNITLDFSVPTQVTINSTGGSSGAGNGKVLADSSDTVYDYLYPKFEAGNENAGISISPYLDTTNTDHLVGFTANVDPVALFSVLLAAIPGNINLQNAFCSAVAACPSPCAAPTNISIVYNGTTSSTSTTTTTAAPTTTTTTTTTLAPITTTTTSTTTTTTTTASLLAPIYDGAQSSATPPNAGAIVSGGTLTSQNPFNDVTVADWQTLTASVPLYCWVAIPNDGSTTVKAFWFGDFVNNGAIGGGTNTFGTPTSVTIGGNPYLLYFTNFQTQFTENILMQFS